MPETVDLEKHINSQAGRLLNLKPGWDGSNSPAISEAAIVAACNVLRHPGYLTPCSNGGVQIDWAGGVELAFTPDGKQEFDDESARASFPDGKGLEAQLRETLNNLLRAAARVDDWLSQLHCVCPNFGNTIDKAQEALMLPINSTPIAADKERDSGRRLLWVIENEIAVHESKSGFWCQGTGDHSDYQQSGYHSDPIAAIDAALKETKSK